MSGRSGSEATLSLYKVSWWRSSEAVTSHYFCLAEAGQLAVNVAEIFSSLWLSEGRDPALELVTTNTSYVTWRSMRARARPVSLLCCDPDKSTCVTVLLSTTECCCSRPLCYCSAKHPTSVLARHWRRPPGESRLWDTLSMSNIINIFIRVYRKSPAVRVSPFIPTCDFITGHT